METIIYTTAGFITLLLFNELAQYIADQPMGVTYLFYNQDTNELVESYEYDLNLKSDHFTFVGVL